MTSAQEKWSQSECPRVQLGPVGLNSSLSWISPGSAAGIASTLACHPLEVLKSGRFTRMGGLVGAFHAGISPALMGMLPCSTCYYFMYETIVKTSYCEAKNKKSLNRPEMLLIGALATSFTASTLSFPLEVARKRLVAGALQGKCPPHMAAAFSEVIPRGLYRGWGAGCLTVMPSSGITWMFYEAWKDVLLVERPLL